MKGKLCGGILSFVLIVNGVYAQDKWEASKDSIWKGTSGSMYKLDPFCNVLMSADGQIWSPNPEKIWQNKEGNYVKLEDRTLTWSSDRTQWNDASKWTDADGKIYKVDESCGLQVLNVPEGKIESPFAKEKREYRKKMNKVMRSIDMEIATYRKDNGRIRRKYRALVQQLEEKKNVIRAKVREMSKKPDAEWAEFKKGLDEMASNSGKALSIK